MRTPRSLRTSYLTMRKRAEAVIDVKNPSRPEIFEDWDYSGKPKVELIAILNSDLESLHYEIGYKRYNPYRGSNKSRKSLDVRSHEPIELSDELKRFLRWHIGGLADEHVAMAPVFVMNLKDRFSYRHWTDRETRTIEVSESRGWIVPRFLSLTIDPGDLELLHFLQVEARMNKKYQSFLRWCVKTVNYLTRNNLTIRARGFAEILKIFYSRPELLKKTALGQIVPRIARKDVFLKLLEAHSLISAESAQELSVIKPVSISGSGFYLNVARNGYRKNGCVSFVVYGGNKIPEPKLKEVEPRINTQIRSNEFRNGLREEARI